MRTERLQCDTNVYSQSLFSVCYHGYMHVVMLYWNLSISVTSQTQHNIPDPIASAITGPEYMNLRPERFGIPKFGSPRD
jgi:hypothetical protein